MHYFSKLCTNMKQFSNLWRSIEEDLSSTGRGESLMHSCCAMHREAQTKNALHYSQLYVILSLNGFDITLILS